MEVCKLGDNINNTSESMWQEAKVILKEKFIALNAYIRGKKCTEWIINWKIWKRAAQ